MLPPPYHSPPPEPEYMRLLPLATFPTRFLDIKLLFPIIIRYTKDTFCFKSEAYECLNGTILAIP